MLTLPASARYKLFAECLSPSSRLYDASRSLAASVLVAGALLAVTAHDAAAQSSRGGGSSSGLGSASRGSSVGGRIGAGVGTGIGAGVGTGIGAGVGTGLGAGAGTGLGAGGSQFTTPAQRSIAPSTLTTPGALPPSAIGAPAPRAGTVAPLAPGANSTFLGSGTTTVTTPGGVSIGVPSAVGTVQTFPGGGTQPATGSALSSGTAGFLPSQAPSTPGGGAEGFKSCMGFWDAGTHMTKREWAVACRRVENRLQGLRKELETSSSQPRNRATRGGVARVRNR